MATKSYSKHKEYKEYSSSRGNVPYTDEQFDMIKSELIPKGSKLDSLGRGVGTREYHYEYKEEKLPSGKYDRKDLHTVEEYAIPPKTVPKASESSSYYYEREERELPSIMTGTRTYNYETTGTSPTPGYSKVKSGKVTKEMTQNVEELDSLLDDLQKDQERQLYKSGYTSDTAESTSFDYRKGTPAKAPSSGYSTLKHEERVESSSWGVSPLAAPAPSVARSVERVESSSWGVAPAPAPAPAPAVTRSVDVRQQLYREEKTESRALPTQLPVAQVAGAVCSHCHHSSSTATLPRSGTPMNKVTTTVKTYTYEVPADQDPTTVPIPTEHHYTEHHHLDSSTTSSPAPPPPAGGCQHCSHCNTRLISQYRSHHTTDDHSTERVLLAPPTHEPHNGHGPYGPSTYKYSETTYSSHEAPRLSSPSPTLSPSPAPFPRAVTPSGGTQQPPKRLDDLLAEFPEARFPTQPDGVVRRKVEVTQGSHSALRDGTSSTPTVNANNTINKGTPPLVGSKNVAGPAVYYPPGHTPFAKKDEPAGGYQSSAMMQGGGAYASGRGMYEYESGARSKEKHSEKKTAVPICLPLCCAMPCVIM
nr:mucin-1 isoform X1 [Vanessa tameamea]